MDRRTETQYRVLFVDSGGVADIYESARDLPTAKRILDEAQEHWSSPKIMQRTVRYSDWTEVDDA